MQCKKSLQSASCFVQSTWLCHKRVNENVVCVQNEYGTAASTWKLPASMRNSGTYETGFLVHLVPICRLMEWYVVAFSAAVPLVTLSESIL